MKNCTIKKEVEVVLGATQPNGRQAIYLRTNSYNEVFVGWTRISRN